LILVRPRDGIFDLDELHQAPFNGFESSLRSGASASAPAPSLDFPPSLAPSGLEASLELDAPLGLVIARDELLALEPLPDDDELLALEPLPDDDELLALEPLPDDELLALEPLPDDDELLTLDPSPATNELLALDSPPATDELLALDSPPDDDELLADEVSPGDAPPGPDAPLEPAVAPLVPEVSSEVDTALVSGAPFDDEATLDSAASPGVAAPSDTSAVEGGPDALENARRPGTIGPASPMFPSDERMPV
jgi:hypothetical protein